MSQLQKAEIRRQEIEAEWERERQSLLMSTRTGRVVPTVSRAIIGGCILIAFGLWALYISQLPPPKQPSPREISPQATLVFGITTIILGLIHTISTWRRAIYYKERESEYKRRLES